MSGSFIFQQIFLNFYLLIIDKSKYLSYLLLARHCESCSNILIRCWPFPYGENNLVKKEDTKANSCPTMWHLIITTVAFLLAQMVKICLHCRRHGFDPWVGKIPWRRKWQPLTHTVQSPQYSWQPWESYKYCVECKYQSDLQTKGMFYWMNKQAGAIWEFTVVA